MEKIQTSRQIHKHQRNEQVIILNELSLTLGFTQKLQLNLKSQTESLIQNEISSNDTSKNMLSPKATSSKQERITRIVESYSMKVKPPGKEKNTQLKDNSMEHENENLYQLAPLKTSQPSNLKWSDLVILFFLVYYIKGITSRT